MFYPSFYSQPFDKGSKLDVTPLIDIGEGETICIELDKRWLNIFSGLVDVFRSQQYLEGTENDILEFQQRVEILQETLALMMECGGMPLDCNEVETCLSSSAIIADLQAKIDAIESREITTYTDILNVYNSVSNVYQAYDGGIAGNTETVLKTVKLGEYQAPFDASSLNVPILTGFKSFIIKMFGGTVVAGETDIFLNVNNDTDVNNYGRARTGYSDSAFSNEFGNAMSFLADDIYSGYIRSENYEVANNKILETLSISNEIPSNSDAPDMEYNAIMWRDASPITSVQIFALENWDDSFRVEVWYEYESEILVPNDLPELPTPPTPPPNFSVPDFSVDFSEQLPSTNYTVVFGERVSSYENRDWVIKQENINNPPVITSNITEYYLGGFRQVNKVVVQYRLDHADIPSFNQSLIRLEYGTSQSNVFGFVDVVVDSAEFGQWIGVEILVGDIASIAYLQLICYGDTTGGTTPDHTIAIDSVEVFYT